MTNNSENISFSGPASFKELLVGYFKIWKYSFAIHTCLSILFIFYLIYVPVNFYTSSSTLIDNTADEDLSASSVLSLPLLQDTSNSFAAEYMNSRDFFQLIYQDIETFKQFFCIQGFNLLGDSKFSKLDCSNQDDPRTELSFEKAHNEFRRSFALTQDKINKKVFKLSTTSVTQESAQIKNLILINRLNEYARIFESDELRNSIDYLTAAIANSKVNEVTLALSKILERKLQKQMLSETSQDYLFSVLDSPSLPELKTGPSRLIMLVQFNLIIFLASIFYIFFLKVKRSFNDTF
jgi:hypothetical protein